MKEQSGRTNECCSNFGLCRWSASSQFPSLCSFQRISFAYPRILLKDAFFPFNCRIDFIAKVFLLLNILWTDPIGDYRELSWRFLALIYTTVYILYVSPTASSWLFAPPSPYRFDWIYCSLGRARKKVYCQLRILCFFVPDAAFVVSSALPNFTLVTTLKAHRRRWRGESHSLSAWANVRSRDSYPAAEAAYPSIPSIQRRQRSFWKTKK